jgi:putative ABC transport system ATP-binding protein
MTAGPLIQVRNLTKAYHEDSERRTVLAGVDLTVQARELVAIRGRSGSGKTTLLNLLGGLDRDYTGSVAVSGRELHALSDRELSALRNRFIGFVFQFHNLLPHLTCQENVALPWHFARQGGFDLGERVRWALERVGLPGVARRLPSQLSGGEQQRVAIARAILFAPPLLLTDEPTGSLDRASGERVLSVFEELNREDGTTVVLVTHEDWVAARMQRVVTVDEGKVLG